MQEVKPIMQGLKPINHNLIVKDVYQFEKLPTPIKSENDKKEYRAIRLRNGLEVVLISDARAETRTSKDKRVEKMAACSLCVEVGSFSDPPEAPGIAHLFKHMLFNGFKKHSDNTQKYNITYFETFISKFGGSHHCDMDNEHTIFYFDIQEKVLFQALCRLALFCFKPLLDIDIFMKESAIIKNEFQNALGLARYGREPLRSFFVRTGHPSSKNTEDETMKLYANIDHKKLYEALHEYTKRHYSAHRMKLVIQSGLPLNTLENFIMTATCFQDVPTNKLPPDDFTEFKDDTYFVSPAFRKMYPSDCTPKDITLQLTWVLPSLLHFYKSKPCKYISQMIEHEGKGSLVSYLRKKMWCDENSTKILRFNSKHSSIYTLIELTVKVSCDEHLEKVLDAIFSYISLLKEEGIQKRIYNDFYTIEENSFRYIDEENPMDYVKNVCKNMRFYPPCYYLTGDKLYFEYNSKAIQKCLNYLVPETVNIMVFEKDYFYEENKIQRWAETETTDIEISKERIERWNPTEPLPEFHVPSSNMFLFNNISLIAIPTKVPTYPIKLYNDRVLEIWYRPDPKLRTPKCHMNLHLISTLGLQSSENAALMDMYCNILKRLLIEDLYPATIAGIEYNLAVTEKGITIKIYGFNEKIPTLLMIIAKYIMAYQNLVTENLFETVKKRQIDIYYDTFIKPDDLDKDMRLWVLKSVHDTNIDKFAVLHKIIFQDFQDFVKSFPDHLYIQCLVQGNMTQDTVINTTQKFVKIINCDLIPDNIRHEIRITQISSGTTYWMLKNLNKFDETSMITNYYQVGFTSIKLSMLIEMMIMIITESLTKFLSQELTHKVSCDLSNINGILGYIIRVYPSTSKLFHLCTTTVQSEKRIDEFLKSFNLILEILSEEDLDLFKEKIKFRNPVYNLEQEVDRNWNEIMKREYMFDRFEKEELELKEIKINDLKEFFAKYILDENNFRKLSIHIIGNNPYERSIDDEEEYEESDRKQDQCIMLRYINTNELYQFARDYKKKLYCYPVSVGLNKRDTST